MIELAISARYVNATAMMVRHQNSCPRRDPVDRIPGLHWQESIVRERNILVERSWPICAVGVVLVTR